jgi:hypothetical protein
MPREVSKAEIIDFPNENFHQKVKKTSTTSEENSTN